MSENQPITGNFEKWRMNVFLIILAGVFIFYAYRLFKLQIVDGEDYLTQADDNRTEEISVSTQRGIIYDRNGYVLARNIPSYNVIITPAYLPTDEGAIQEVYRQLSELIDIPVSEGDLSDENVLAFKPCENDFGITEIVYIGDTNAPYDPIQVKCDVSKEVALMIMENADDWPGTGIEVSSVREYPTGYLTSEIIGFLGPIPATQEDYYAQFGFIPNEDKVGYAGVESSLQEILGGYNGTRVVEVDVAGQILRDLEPPVEPVQGNNVVLTIDTRLQMAARTSLVEEINGWNAYLNRIMSSNGVVIALNPKTGEILALVSYPNYENNRMTRFIPAYYYEQLTEDRNRPLFNHAISAELPPGSVFKLAAAIGAMNEEVLSPNQLVKCPGKITVSQKYTANETGTDRDYVCWTEVGHGEVDFVHSIALSCDIYYYKISGGYKDEVPEGLGIWRLGEYAKALGYGDITGIELPGEQPGLIPDPDWKRLTVGENWATGDTYIASMGQGYVLATPLQVALSFATLANDGKQMRPTLVREILDSEGNVVQEFEPDLVRDITVDPVIQVYDENNFTTGEYKVVEPWVVELAKEGMRLVVEPGGTADAQFEGMEIASAGKTGTAEYCDDVAQEKNLCQSGSWPTHSWYAGYAPYDDPEIVVIAFVYNGGEGASVAAPIVRRVMEAYFELKAIDLAASGG